MRKLTPLVLALAVLVVVCATAVSSRAASSVSSPVLRAPAGTAAAAARDARAALAAVALPAGSVRLATAPRALRAEPVGPDFTLPYVTFKTATEYWSLPDAGAASALLAQAPKGSSTWLDSGALSGAQIMLRSLGRWIGPRWLVIETKPDPGAGGRWLAELQGVAVWTPQRLVLPGDVASVTVRRLQDGATLATVTSAAQVASIVATLNGLAVDDAIRAVYACPALQSGRKPGFELLFDGSTGALLASATTEWCPNDVSLKVGTHGPQQLIAGDVVGALEKILGIALPPAF
ncbi:MAG: hypothetical protein ABSD82_11845 [Solirubrobacteraceae bacterium]|jgi:hypothetical protein